jgi:hypothetical protein
MEFVRKEMTVPLLATMDPDLVRVVRIAGAAEEERIPVGRRWPRNRLEVPSVTCLILMG